MPSFAVQQVLRAARHELQRTITEHMPAGDFREFQLWALNSPSPYCELFLQVTGLVQIAQLTTALFNGIASTPLHWAQIASGAATLATYFVFEATSDDLGLNLAEQTPEDTTFTTRLQLVFTFNNAIVDYLQTGSCPDWAILRRLTRGISAFQFKLRPDKYNTLAAAFVAQNPHISSAELEFGVWPSLAANIYAAQSAVEQLDDCLMQPIFRDGLIQRYRSLSYLMEHSPIPLEQRADIGAKTILVLPTLAFYLGLWAEQVQPEHTLRPLIRDGSLENAILDASLLSRLLNDLGGIALLSDPDLQSLFDDLKSQSRTNITLPQLITLAAPQYGSLFTRFQKDINYGEYNCCLDDLRGLPAPQALPILEERVRYYASLYHCQRAELNRMLATLTHRSGSHIVGQLIQRFVTFHEALYAQPHTELAGEYTI